MQKVNIAFFGSPRLSAACLEELQRSLHVSMVVTQPDKRGGRGRAFIQTPVAEVALQHGIDLYKPQKIDEGLADLLRTHGINLIIVVAYGRILPEKVIGYPVLGSLNLHPSLLPRYRGPSPIEAVLLNGEGETGITVQLMEKEVDSGDILAAKRVLLSEETTQSELLQTMIELSPSFLCQIVGEYIEGKIQLQRQDERNATYCSVIRKGDGLIQWSGSARSIHNKIRAYNLWPVAHTALDGKLLRLYRSRVHGSDGSFGGCPGTVVETKSNRGILVKTGEGILCVLELQLENRRRMGFKEFMIGYRNLKGKVLG